jgi:hypothetical protein
LRLWVAILWPFLFFPLGIFTLIYLVNNWVTLMLNTVLVPYKELYITADIQAIILHLEGTL